MGGRCEGQMSKNHDFRASSELGTGVPTKLRGGPGGCPKEVPPRFWWPWVRGCPRWVPKLVRSLGPKTVGTVENHEKSRFFQGFRGFALPGPAQTCSRCHLGLGGPAGTVGRGLGGPARPPWADFGRFWRPGTCRPGRWKIMKNQGFSKIPRV